MNMQHSGLYQYLKEVGDTNIHLDNYDFIPTVKYRKNICGLCKELNSLNNIHTYCLAVALNNNTIFYTSNSPKYSACYISSGLCRADNYFIRAYHHGGHYLITSGLYGDTLQHAVIDILENRFQVYNTYCLLRRCEDCTVIIAISYRIPLPDPKSIYQQTVTFIEDFTVKYFDKFIGIYVENLPGFKYSLFATNSHYRSMTIKRRENVTNKHLLLTAREIECLYWISRGKTSGEISLLMNISEHTVHEHRKNIMKKINVSNVAYAVQKALKERIIS